MRIISTTAILLALIAAAPIAQAVKGSASGSVEIVEPLGFLQSFSDFGTMKINRSSSLFKRVMGASNSKKQYVQDLPESEYMISGSVVDSIQINVETPQNASSDVSVGDFVVDYSKGQNSDSGVVKQAPGRGASLKLGGKLKVAGGAKAGIYEPEFSISVYYE